MLVLLPSLSATVMYKNTSVWVLKACLVLYRALCDHVPPAQLPSKAGRFLNPAWVPPRRLLRDVLLPGPAHGELRGHVHGIRDLKFQVIYELFFFFYFYHLNLTGLWFYFFSSPISFLFKMPAVVYWSHANKAGQSPSLLLKLYLKL